MSASPQLCDQREPLDMAVLVGALDACPAGLAIAESGRILYAGQTFARTLGLPQNSELQGRPLTELLPVPPQRLPDWNHGEVFNSVPDEIVALASDFRANHRDLQVVCIRAAGGNSISVTQSQKMEALGRLVSAVAHDFNNLLTGIMLYCDLLIAGLEPETRLRRHADAIHKAGISGITLIQQLLTLSRNEPVELSPLSWNDLVLDMLSLLNRLTGENIGLQVRLSDPIGMVKMDSGQARQIILNLVLNARDAMPKGGTIVFSTQNCSVRLNDAPGKTSCVEFAVTDTGEGMDAKTLARLFQPYFTTKPPGEGSGLGLVTVQSIIKKAGGQVQVESEIGKGTRVAIRLPEIAVGL